MTRPIQLHADLSIDRVREAEAVEYFETVYRPTASRFEGYIDLRLLKLQGALAGSAPAGVITGSRSPLRARRCARSGWRRRRTKKCGGSSRRLSRNASTISCCST
jgi:hypothetical protein